jgi:hypothetical protein
MLTGQSASIAHVLAQMKRVEHRNPAPSPAQSESHAHSLVHVPPRPHMPRPVPSHPLVQISPSPQAWRLHCTPGSPRPLESTAATPGPDGSRLGQKLIGAGAQPASRNARKKRFIVGGRAPVVA